MPLTEAAVATSIPCLYLVPSHLDLVELDYRLLTRAGWAFTLRKRVQEAGEAYDLILIDCPPSLGILTRMALVAAKLALVPVQAEWLSLRGLHLLNRVVDEIRTETDHSDLEVRYLLTMQQRTKHGQEIEEEIRQHFKESVLQTVIRRSVRFADSTVAGEPLLLFDRDHHGSQAYMALALEIAAHERPARVRAR